MNDNGITCGVHYEAAHLHEVYKINNTNCPLSEKKSLETVSIPFHEGLTIKDIMFIIKVISQYNEDR